MTPRRGRAAVLAGLTVLGVVSVGASQHATASAPVPTPKKAVVAPSETQIQSQIKAYFASGASAEDESGRTLYNAQAIAGSKTGSAGQVLPGAYASGLAQAAAVDSLPSVTGKTWQQIGNTSLNSIGDGYGAVNELGIPTDTGRVEDFSYDPAVQGRWFAAVANGGIWETTDAGMHWKSIGDGLPTQITGTVLYDGGRLLVGSGDPAFGGSSIAGTGAYYSDDDGATWVHAVGPPSGSLSFQLREDPNVPSLVYLATSMGLWRSTNKGANYTNVVLPTTCESLTDLNCYFANIVTDVVVRAPDAGATGPGAVLAAVGWRNGQKLNANGKPQAPQNGLYTSTTGAPKSFTYIDPGATAPGSGVTTTGLPETVNFGRTTLAAAYGAAQDHDYVYAVIQDAGKMNAQTGAFDTPQTGLTSTAVGTVLNGIYGSMDFGKTWTKLADPTSLVLPTAQSALTGPGATGYAPGVQAWYNSYIIVDPTTQTPVTNAPNHLIFGLEEIWQNQAADGTLSPIVISPAGSVTQTSTGTTQFQAVGRYYGGNSCYGLNATLPVPCTTNLQNSGATTTHPDQHAGEFVPDGNGGYTLLAGDDGGVFSQAVAAGAVPSQGNWGQGSNGVRGSNLQTFLPYDVSMSKDGTVVSGLQDNGEMKIDPSGQAFEVYGGDGFYSQIDPNDSNTFYEEYTYGSIAVTTTGGTADSTVQSLAGTGTGASWTNLATGFTATTALFATPFMMDPKDSQHLIAAGRQILDTTAGPATTAPGTDEKSWTADFDLGTRLKPGDATAVAVTGQADPTLNSPNNISSAVDVNGANVYVGYCGYCDILTGGLPFQSGIATNVGGSALPSGNSSAGWHIASAIGLPQRYVTGIRQDPNDPKTVYATEGGYGRRWIAPGGLGDDTSKIGTGHLFVSHDAGEHFTDISGNLPDVPAYDVIVHNGYVVVGTDTGVYATPVGAPGSFAPYASGMPKAPVVRLANSPRNGDELLAANYGRGDYLLPATAGVVTAPVITGGTSAAPVTAGGTTTGSGSLASTGLDAGLPALAVVLLGGGALVRQRRRAHL